MRASVPPSRRPGPDSQQSASTAKYQNCAASCLTAAAATAAGMVQKKKQLSEAERNNLPSSLYILSGQNPFRRAAIWIARWIVFEWVIILTIIGKNT